MSTTHDIHNPACTIQRLSYVIFFDKNSVLYRSYWNWNDDERADVCEVNRGNVCVRLYARFGSERDKFSLFTFFGIVHPLETCHLQPTSDYKGKFLSHFRSLFLQVLSFQFRFVSFEMYLMMLKGHFDDNILHFQSYFYVISLHVSPFGRKTKKKVNILILIR